MTECRRPARGIAGACAVAFSLWAGGCKPGAEAHTAPAEYRGLQIQPPLPAPDFTFTDFNGQPYRFAERTRGKLALLFFGYTHCPDVCPVHMANLAAVLPRLSAEQRSRIVVAFVTTDPDRDTPARLHEWLGEFDSSFVGLRGSVADVDRIQRSLGFPPSVREVAGANGEYGVGHVAILLAFTPDGRAHIAYPAGTRRSDWAHDLPVLLTSDWARASPVRGSAGPLEISHVVVTAPIADAPAALYFTVANRGAEPDTLIGVDSDAARSTVLHDAMSNAAGMAMMERLAIPARGEIGLHPGGMHAMLDGFTHRLHAGDSVRVGLVFRNAGRIALWAPVLSYASIDSAFPPTGAR